MNKKTVHIKGMHCASCELLVEDELLKIPAVCSAKVYQEKGVAEVFYEGEVKDKDIEKAVEEAGYSLGIDDKPFFSRNKKDYLELLKSGVLLFAIFSMANTLGLFKLSAISGGDYSSLPIVLLIGLTAGISTCMALVGGLVLGASARFAEKHPTATPLQKFKPHLFFNLGRIISFFIFGGLIGYVGSFLQLSTTILGILTIIVGFVMLVLGMQLVEVFPKISRFRFTLPKGLSRLIGINTHSEKEYSHKNSAILGGLTFFLPCGFTQAMQLYAISTGSIVAGAFTMGVFAIGTAPGLLGIGGITALVKGIAAKLFFRTVGLAVIFLALFNISNGYNLSGIKLSDLSPIEIDLTASGFNGGSRLNIPNLEIENGAQIIRMAQDASGYSPNKFTIKKGIPVKWIINSTDSYTCASSLVSSALGVRKSLQPGENIIEFTPEKIGTIRFSCSMGMYTGSFNVVDEVSGTAQNTPPQAQPGTAQKAPSCGSGGCGCGGGKRPDLEAKPLSLPVAAVKQGNTQVIKTTYTYDNDIQPNKFSVKAGSPVRLEVDSKDDGSGCMGSITVPSLTEKVDLLKKGKTTVFEFTPKNRGEYPITCAMGIPRGVINVI